MGVSTTYSKPIHSHIYNTCVTLTVSVDPYLIRDKIRIHGNSESHKVIPVSFVLLVSNLNRCQNAKLPPIYWRLNSSLELKKVTEQLTRRSKPTNRFGQRIATKPLISRGAILQTVLAEIGSLTPTDVEVKMGCGQE